MPRSYCQLQASERSELAALLRQGLTLGAIARQLERDKSTLSREIRRNSGADGHYSGAAAQQLAEDRRHQAAARPRKLQRQDWQLICRLLLKHWSPEQIQGHLKVCQVAPVSTSWIYRLIQRDRAAGGIDYCFLRQRGKRRQ